MARGKQTLLAANRRLESAMAHIDRLTDEITTLKMRARDAEALANSAEMRLHWAQNELKRQEEEVDRCIRYVDSHLKHVKESRREWDGKPKDELVKLLFDVVPMDCVTTLDAIEMLWRRYPHLLYWLNWGPRPDGTNHLYRESRFLDGMSDDALRSLQRVRRERGIASWDPERDMADIMNDMLDITEMRLTEAEVNELLNIEEA